MKYKNYTLFFAIFAAVAILVAPFAAWELFLGDPVFDSIFSKSLSSLPVSKGGRQMPFSSAASDSLRAIGGKVSTTIDGKKISASKWLALLVSDAKKMASAPVFRTDNRDLQTLLGANGRNYSYNDFMRRYAEILKTADSGNTPFARACAAALDAAAMYEAVSHTLGVELVAGAGIERSARIWRESVESARSEFENAKKQNREPDRDKLEAAAEYLSKLGVFSQFEKNNSAAVARAIPKGGLFATPAELLIDRRITWNTGSDAEGYLEYAKFCDAVRRGDSDSARKSLDSVFEKLLKNKKIDFTRINIENIINRLDLFFGGFVLFALAGVIISVASFFSRGRDRLFILAKIFLIFAVSAQFAAIAARMYIQMRPPVTNMYSSVVFTGALAAAVALIMFARSAWAGWGLVSSVVGGLSLIVAMNLPYGGDTMAMMRAVLNSNFWLTVHVVTIMVGYCGVFAAGFAALFRLVSNLFCRMDFGEATGLTARNVYAVLCFALMFSFSGTMLGGLWADMSWGRFWGWDPKENGALMIVLWCAAAIHSKNMRLVSDRVFLAFAVVGNVIAAWAWFGVNLMGVGLHSYGFVEGGWKWFFAFVAVNLLVLPLALIKSKPSSR